MRFCRGDLSSLRRDLDALAMDFLLHQADSRFTQGQFILELFDLAQKGDLLTRENHYASLSCQASFRPVNGDFRAIEWHRGYEYDLQLGALLPELL